MREIQASYRVFWDELSTPPMFGIQCENGERIQRISTDFTEVNQLVEHCNRGELSPLHLSEVVEDFRHS